METDNKKGRVIHATCLDVCNGDMCRRAAIKNS